MIMETFLKLGPFTVYVTLAKSLNTPKYLMGLTDVIIIVIVILIILIILILIWTLCLERTLFKDSIFRLSRTLIRDSQTAKVRYEIPSFIEGSLNYKQLEIYLCGCLPEQVQKSRIEWES